MTTPEKDSTLCALRLAVDARDADALEHAIARMFRIGPTADLGPTLIELLDSPWHCRHEDVVRALQDLKLPDAVSALRRAAEARHEYLAYDDFFELARKCTWALADIGTVEAKQALHELSRAGNETIAGYALKRLRNWEREGHRKGARMKVTTAGNTEVPAYLALRSLGFEMRKSRGQDQELWFAVRDDLELVGASPLELLALPRLADQRGPAWQATDEEIEDFLRKFG